MEDPKQLGSSKKRQEGSPEDKAESNKINQVKEAEAIPENQIIHEQNSGVSTDLITEGCSQILFHEDNSKKAPKIVTCDGKSPIESDEVSYQTQRGSHEFPSGSNEFLREQLLGGGGGGGNKFDNSNRADSRSEVQFNVDKETFMHSPKLNEIYSCTEVPTNSKFPISNEKLENETNISIDTRVCPGISEIFPEKPFHFQYPPTGNITKPVKDHCDEDLSSSSENQNSKKYATSTIPSLCKQENRRRKYAHKISLSSDIGEVSLPIDSQESLLGEICSKETENQDLLTSENLTANKPPPKTVPTLSELSRRAYKKMKFIQSGASDSNEKSNINLHNMEDKYKNVPTETKVYFETYKEEMETLIVAGLQDVIANVEHSLNDASISTQEHSKTRIIPGLQNSLTEVELTVNSMFTELVVSITHSLNKIMSIAQNLVSNERVFNSIAEKKDSVIENLKSNFKMAKHSADEILDSIRSEADGKLRSYKNEADRIARKAVGQVQHAIDNILEALELTLSLGLEPLDNDHCTSSQELPLCLRPLNEVDCESVELEKETEANYEFRFSGIREIVLSALMEAEFSVVNFIANIQASIEFGQMNEYENRGISSSVNPAMTDINEKELEVTDITSEIHEKVVPPKIAIDSKQKVSMEHKFNRRENQLDVSIPEELAKEKEISGEPVATSSPSKSSSNRLHSNDCLLDNSISFMDLSDITSAIVELRTSDPNLAKLNSPALNTSGSGLERGCEVEASENVFPQCSETNPKNPLTTEIDGIIVDIKLAVRSSFQRVKRCLRSSLKEIEATELIFHTCIEEHSNEFLKKMKDVADHMAQQIDVTLHTCYDGEDRETFLTSASAIYRDVMLTSPLQLSRPLETEKRKSENNMLQLESTPTKNQDNYLDESECRTPENSYSQLSSCSYPLIIVSGTEENISSERANVFESPTSPKFTTSENHSKSNSDSNESPTCLSTFFNRSANLSCSSRIRISPRRASSVEFSSKESINSNSRKIIYEKDRRRLSLLKPRKIAMEKDIAISTESDLLNKPEAETKDYGSFKMNCTSRPAYQFSSFEDGRTPSKSEPVFQFTPTISPSLPEARTSDPFLKYPNSIKKGTDRKPEQLVQVFKFSAPEFKISSQKDETPEQIFKFSGNRDSKLSDFSGIESKELSHGNSEDEDEVSDISATAVKTPPNSFLLQYTPHTRVSTGSKRSVSRVHSSKLKQSSDSSLDTSITVRPVNIIEKINKFPGPDLESPEENRSDSGNSDTTASNVFSESKHHVTSSTKSIQHLARTEPDKGSFSLSSQRRKIKRVQIETNVELEIEERIVRSKSCSSINFCNESSMKTRRSLNFDIDTENEESIYESSPELYPGISRLDFSPEPEHNINQSDAKK